MQTRRRSRPTDVRALVVLFAATGLLAACIGAASPATAPATSSHGPSASTPAQTLAAVTPTPGATLAAVTPTPGTATVVTVAWGKIWDQVPASFPLPFLPDALPGRGPAGFAHCVAEGPLHPGHSPNNSTVWSTAVNPASAATCSAQRSTARPSTSTLVPQERQMR